MTEPNGAPSISLDSAPLASCEAFQGLNAENVAQLLETTGAEVLRLEDAQAVLTSGQPVAFYPFVLSGGVRATMLQGGKRRTVARMGAGESFAEAAATLGVCPVDVFAEGETLVLEIPAEALGKSQTPEAHAVLSYLEAKKAERIGTLARSVAVIGEPRLEDRILADLSQRPLDSEGWPLLPPTRREWADYLRVDEKTLSRKLRDLCDSGELDHDGTRVREARG